MEVSEDKVKNQGNKQYSSKLIHLISIGAYFGIIFKTRTFYTTYLHYTYIYIYIVYRILAMIP